MAQLSLFDLGLNNSDPPSQPGPLRTESSPPASAATPVAFQASIQQASTQAVRQNASHIVQEADQNPVAKPDVSSNGQQSKASPILGVSSAHQHPVTARGENLSFRASQVRDVDLESVVLDLGLEQDKHDKHKWRGNGQIISINGQKFYDHLSQQGSAGAIDLVMHVQNCQYPEAVDWLSNQSATPQTVRDRSGIKVHKPVTRDEPKYLAVPIKDETKWFDVRLYLVEVRGLPEPLIDHAHQLGLIYSDTQRNAVFLRYAENGWHRGEMSGASLRGTKGNFHGLSPGSNKDKGWFWFGLGKGEVERVVLVESAIDALSFAALDKHNHQETKTVYLSTDGAGAIPTVDLQSVLERGGQVVVGFDADRAGEQMAWKVAQSLPGVTRLQPASGKDWNEQLLGNNQSRQSFGTPTEWSRIAKALGKPESYINRVAEVVAAFSTGQPLSDKATNAMQSDCNVYKQSLESLWKWHNTARALGKPSASRQK